MICHILIDPLVLRCDVVFFQRGLHLTSCHRLVALSESCLAWEGDASYFLPPAVYMTSYQYNLSQPGHVVHVAAQVMKKTVFVNI